MSVGLGEVGLGAVVEVEQDNVSAEPASYVGDAHFFRLAEAVAEDDHVEGLAPADVEHLAHIVGLRDTVSGALEEESPGRQQPGIEADIEDVCHLCAHKLKSPLT